MTAGGERKIITVADPAALAKAVSDGERREAEGRSPCLWMQAGGAAA